MLFFIIWLLCYLVLQISCILHFALNRKKAKNVYKMSSGAKGLESFFQKSIMKLSTISLQGLYLTVPEYE